MKKKHKIVIAMTGASGAIYSKVLIDKLISIKDQIEDIGLIMSENAKFVWKTELKNEDYKNLPFKMYTKHDFTAPFASGSANYNTMIVCPCSMGTLSRIANGISNDLTTRAADVMMKERRRLILITRESPLSLIHIKNMKAITESGGIICPASPSFYSHPNNFEDLASTIIDRVLSLSDIEIKSFKWGEKQ
tara:strand:- start:321 stop:893 length:573 start_codon:yes stop_codon:yes gene_type:complete